MGGEGSVDCGDVVKLGFGIVALHRVYIAGLYRRGHVGLHGQKRIARRRIGVVGNVHATKRASAGSEVVAVDHMAVGEDVSEGALGTKLAVSLAAVSFRRSRNSRSRQWEAIYVPW